MGTDKIKCNVTPPHMAREKERLREMKKCIGWKETEGKCNSKSLRDAPWCDDCDELRIADLDKDFEKMATAMGIDYKEI